MKVAALCSAGGSAFFTAWDIAASVGRATPQSTLLITDRPCGAEALAQERGIAVRRIQWTNRAAFGAEARSILLGEGCQLALLYFLRLVDEAVFRSLPTVNFHPSLLPAFGGFGALKTAHASGVRFLGATAHVADASADGGAIIAQVATPLPPGTELSRLARISFLQKTYLGLVVVELTAAGSLRFPEPGGPPCWSGPVVTSPSACPALPQGPMRERFASFQRQQGVEALVP